MTDIDEATGRADAVTLEAFKATNAVKDFITTAAREDITHAAYTELARAAGRIMRFLVEADLAEEHFADVLTEAGDAAFGHLAMQAVGPFTDTGQRTEVKKRFLEVAEVLGPDHVEAFRVAGVFMAKTEQF